MEKIKKDTERAMRSRGMEGVVVSKGLLDSRIVYRYSLPSVSVSEIRSLTGITGILRLNSKSYPVISLPDITGHK